MTPERLRFLEQIVQAALGRDEDSRGGFLASVCGTDAALRSDVDALIAAYKKTVTPIEAAAPLPEAAPPLPDRPDRIGPYRILKALGEGGMGSVFLAQQTEPIRRVRCSILCTKRRRPGDPAALRSASSVPPATSSVSMRPCTLSNGRCAQSPSPDDEATLPASAARTSTR